MWRRLFDALIYSQGPAAAAAAGKRGGEEENTKLFDHFKRRGLTRKRLGEEKKKEKPDYSGCGGSDEDLARALRETSLITQGNVPRLD